MVSAFRFFQHSVVVSGCCGTREGITVESVVLLVVIRINVIGAGDLENGNGRRGMDMGTATEIDEVATLVNLPLDSRPTRTERGDVTERIIFSL